MTTIVYCNKTKVIACDGLGTAGSEIMSTMEKKYIENNGVLFFMAGKAAQMTAFVEVYSGFTSRLDSIDVSVILVKANTAYRAGYDSHKKYIWEHKLERHYGIGTGANFAVGALGAGADAKTAVEIAACTDLYTGGLIRTYDIITGIHS